MRFLIDENLPRQLVAALATAGFEAWYSTSLCGDSPDDRTIWQAACDRGAIVVTKDDDFLRFVEEIPVLASVVILQIGNCSRAEAIKLVIDNLTLIRSELDTGRHLIKL